MMHDDLDDILSDESLFADLEMDQNLFSNERYRRTVAVKASSSQRKRMSEGFNEYKWRFAQVQDEVARGYRIIKSFDDIHTGDKISKENPIKQGSFYIDNGIMLYIDRIYDPKTGDSKESSTTRNDKIHVVYENGTENDVKLLSLISSLYDKKRNGRFVTEVINNLMEGDDKSIITGYIYVVRYAGEDPQFLNMENLYKIGCAKNIKKRLDNTANESTYLFAPVKLVCQFEVQNIDVRKVEKYIHHVLADKRLDLSVVAPNGRQMTIKEWFLIDLESIQDIINKMVIDLQV